MKVFVLFLNLCFSLFVFSQNKQGYSYKISGKTEENSAGQVFMEFTVGAKKIKDSITPVNGSFMFEGNLPEPVIAKIYTKTSVRQSIELVLANTNAELLLSGNKWTLQQSNGLSLISDYKKLTVVDSIKATYYGEYGVFTRNKDSVGLKKISRIFDSLNIVDQEITSAFIRNNPSSPLIANAMYRLVMNQKNIDTLERIWNTLPAWVSNSPTGMEIRQRMNGSTGIAVGIKAPLFTQNDINGKSFSLNQMAGKYVLVDFWASWCKPCRKEHPKLKEVYQEYQKKGFEVVEVSLDTNKDLWKQAVKADQLVWKQISDLNGFDNPIAVNYGVRSIPSNFLINQQGVIIAKNIKPEELKTILSDLLK